MTISLYPPVVSGSSSSTATFVQYGGTTIDAFGRLRVSQPYTLYDSQARYAKDSTFSYSSTGTGATSTYNTNQSSVSLTVGTSAGTTIAQTYRSFPYQPGKGLLTLQTFTMAAAQTNLTQRVGYFNDNNGVYLEQTGTGSYPLYLTVRTYTSGSVSNARTVRQSSWNVDKFDGTGPSGITIDVTKTQIFWMDFEWLGVGNVRCGFVVNSTFYVAHVFSNPNTQTVVYMQTAILPIRYEISSSGATTGATLQQICSSVISEGGYEQISQQYVASRPITSALSLGTSGTFYPIVSIRLNASYLGAIVIPITTGFLPVSGTGTFEVCLIKNASLTGATWSSTLAGGQVDVDTGATAFGTSPSGDSITQLSYATSNNQSSSSTTAASGYNWDLQLGVAVGATASDTYTLGVRGNFTSSPSCVGAITFYNLTV